MICKAMSLHQCRCSLLCDAMIIRAGAASRAWMRQILPAARDGEKWRWKGHIWRFLDVQSIFCFVCFRKCLILPMWISCVRRGPHIVNRLEHWLTTVIAKFLSGHRWNVTSVTNWCLNIGNYEYKLAKRCVVDVKGASSDIMHYSTISD